MATTSTGIYGHWGAFSAIGELPNSGGAAVQSSELKAGDIAFVTGGALYVCTNATLGAAVWAALATV